jgi:hypothetical protein
VAADERCARGRGRNSREIVAAIAIARHMLID